VPGATDRCRSRALTAWAGLAAVESLTRFQVLVRPRTPLCPPGWIGILRLQDTVTVAVPHLGLVPTLHAALVDEPPASAATSDIATCIPGVVDVLGPAALFFASATPSRRYDPQVHRANVGELAGLFASVSAADLNESGLEEITSTASIIKDDNGTIVAACGYQRWPQNIAHLSVLAHPAYRNRGAGRAVAAAAIAHALDENLLVQWRARPDASKAVARALGLVELGAQLSIRINPRPPPI
jgi:GNAT superfamily N-acetyltransferase